MSQPIAGIAFCTIALGCAGIACYHDLRTRRIPNRLTAPAALAALLAHLAVGGWSSLGLAAAAGLAAGFAMFLFFLAGGMGAGDVKLMAAVACFTGFAPLGTLLLTTALAGSVLAVAIAWRHGAIRSTLAKTFRLAQHHQHNGLTPHADHNLRSAGALRMPFALPIAAGCMCTLAVQLSAGAR